MYSPLETMPHTGDARMVDGIAEPSAEFVAALYESDAADNECPNTTPEGIASWKRYISTAAMLADELWTRDMEALQADQEW